MRTITVMAVAVATLCLTGCSGKPSNRDVSSAITQYFKNQFEMESSYLASTGMSRDDLVKVIGSGPTLVDVCHNDRLSGDKHDVFSGAVHCDVRVNEKILGPADFNVVMSKSKKGGGWELKSLIDDTPSAELNSQFHNSAFPLPKR